MNPKDEKLEHQEQQVMESRYQLPYNWFGQTWSRSWRQKNGLWLLAKELTGILNDKIVLDAGCGDGWYTARMSKESSNVYGKDLSERAIKFAQTINPLPQFTQGSLAGMEYKDKSFDVIFSFQVIEHIPPEQLPEVVDELYRILKDDGKLLVTVPSINRKMSRAHFQHFSTETLVDVFSRHFVLDKACGQEKYTPFLHVLERVIENRCWVLKNVGERFNARMYINVWNKTSSQEGQNIVALFSKKM